MFTIFVATLAWAQITIPACNNESPQALASIEIDVEGDRCRARSNNFAIWNCSPHQDACQLAKQCEVARGQLLDYWCDSRQHAAWSSPCIVVVHTNRASYMTSAGPSGAQTRGTNVIRIAASEVQYRRIDLLPNDLVQLTALHHEITHILFADFFCGEFAPRWAEEGAAILADDAQKRELHHRDARLALQRGFQFPWSDLFDQQHQPSRERVPAFYGQSGLLVEFLVAKKDGPTFIKFLRDTKQLGYDHALRENYGIDSVRELDHCLGEQMLNAPAIEDVAIPKVKSQNSK